MTRETALIALGVLIMLTPFIGLPVSWRAYIVPVLGLLVVLVAVTLRARRMRTVAPSPETSSMTTPVV
ncbi:MAG: hypothetical protein ABA06_04790 [Parcubacteria bacterium C7867-001]|nr:MAG: hypothetical protein ABA06_04790 [Parcubacteria bacterium C7867-001]